MITTTIEWFDPREKLPEEDGNYLIYTGNAIPILCLRFGIKLCDVDDIDFPKEYYSNHSGFVDFDGSRYRWIEVPLEEIKYWAKMPEISTIKEEN